MVFVPLPATWSELGENFPRVLTSAVTEQMGGQTGFLLNFPSLHMDSQDKTVHFKTNRNWLRRKTWIINTSQDTDPALRRFASKLARAKGIEAKVYPSGLDLAV